MLPSEAMIEEMCVFFMSVWVMFPFEATVEEMVVIFVSVWTMIPSVWTTMLSEATIG